MCGIAGLISRHGTSREIAVSMGDAIAHRGPDSRGTWLSDDGRVALSHRRLAIVDLTQAGHQPMVSADTRFVIVYNGEIYNHAELRAQLDAEGRGARPWRGYSDTEILLAGFSAWGVEATLKRARGLAIHPEHRSRLRWRYPQQRQTDIRRIDRLDGRWHSGVGSRSRLHPNLL